MCCNEFYGRFYITPASGPTGGANVCTAPTHTGACTFGTGECPPVPAVSEWGMASVVLLLIAGLTIKFGAIASRKAA